MTTVTQAERTRPAAGIPELRQEFALADGNQDGLIDYLEFRDLLNGLEAQMTEHEMHTGLDAIDTNRDGRIDCDEFIEWWLTD